MTIAPELIIISGPTAVGKTAAAVELARELNTEIISADSMQVYQYLSIGTGKPTSEETLGVPYHLIDFVPPNEQYNLGRFLRDADPIIARLFAERKIPIICGGTGLYLRGLLHGIFDEVIADTELRTELRARWDAGEHAALYAELLTVDPAAAYIAPADRQRVLRALEVCKGTGRPFTSFQKQFETSPRFRARILILTLPRKDLYARIESRADRMIANGLTTEVEDYLRMGFSTDNPAFKALGYSEIADSSFGQCTLDAAIATMKQKTRNYAKRQMTWFRGMRGAEFLDVSNHSPAAVCNLIKKTLASPAPN